VYIHMYNLQCPKYHKRPNFFNVLKCGKKGAQNISNVPTCPK
jgi:hypothetical protein